MEEHDEALLQEMDELAFAELEDELDLNVTISEENKSPYTRSVSLAAESFDSFVNIPNVSDPKEHGEPVKYVMPSSTFTANAPVKKCEYTFKLQIPRAPEKQNIITPRIATYKEPKHCKDAPVFKYNLPTPHVLQSNYMKKNSRTQWPYLFINIYQLYYESEEWTLRNEIVIPFIQNYVVGDLKRIIAEEFVGMKHKAYLFNSNTAESLFLQDSLKDDNVLISDLESVHFTAKVCELRPILHCKYITNRWNNYTPTQNVILVESHVHKQRFIRMPIKKCMTVEDVRGYFAWKNGVLSMNVGLRFGEEILNVENRKIKQHERHFQAYVRRPRLSSIITPGCEPFVPPSVAAGKKELFKSQISAKRKNIIVRCNGMKPKYHILPLRETTTIKEAADQISIKTVTDRGDVYLYHSGEFGDEKKSTKKVKKSESKSVKDFKSYFFTADRRITDPPLTAVVMEAAPIRTN